MRENGHISTSGGPMLSSSWTEEGGTEDRDGGRQWKGLIQVAAVFLQSSLDEWRRRRVGLRHRKVKTEGLRVNRKLPSLLAPIFDVKNQ